MPRATETAWRRAMPADLDAIMAIQAAVHPTLQERAAVFENRLALFPEGYRIFEDAGAARGYGIAHPWTLDDVPPLDELLDRLPAPPDCLYLHDVALLPAARGHGAGRAFIALATRLARAGGLDWLTLVSVYGTGSVWQRCGFALRPLPGLAAQFGTAAAARYMAAEVGAKLRGTCKLP